MSFKIEACNLNNIDVAVKTLKENYVENFPAIRVTKDKILGKGISLYLLSDISQVPHNPIATFGLSSAYEDEDVWKEVRASLSDDFDPKKDAVVGQLSISSKDVAITRVVYGLLLDKAQQMGYERLFFILRGNVDFYKKLFNAILIKSDCNYDIGVDRKISALVVETKEIKQRGLRFLNRNLSSCFNKSDSLIKREIMNKSHWDEYSSAFDSIITPPQVELYNTIAPLLSGAVLDAGCGNGNLAVFVNGEVSTYHGVDTSLDMVQKANANLQRLKEPQRFQAFHVQLEEFVNTHQYDVITLINSVYAMDNPSLVFKHCYNLLAPGGLLIIANPNENMTKSHMEMMIELYEAQFSGNPAVADFKRLNLQFVTQYQHSFYTLDKIEGWLEQAGLSVTNRDCTHFHGAMNLIVAKK
ncbi:class I SAM-dependent methyltransferase [Pseudoalteromonas piscicida]|uniref:class I SAM-dependent methyltransferase n=1 Tax=Pseudoalteromonas piscicida TaxID=43662 RepID=UPI0030CA008C